MNIKELVFGSYLKAEKYLNGFDSSTRDLALTQNLFQELGISFSRWPRVVVTGSKGKGSTAVMLASILAASGEKVGLVTSPELRRFNERIRINGVCVSDEDLEQAAKEIAPTVHPIVSEILPPKYLGPGGIILALAAKIFIKRQVTVVVIEAGRGGEHDESRLVAANVSIITPIMLKHSAKIGPTLKDIARTKTYIAAPGSIIVSASQEPAIKKVISEVAGKLSASLFFVDESVKISRVKIENESTLCNLQIDGDKYNNLELALIGSHQVENAATAILAARALKKFGAKCTREGIYTGVLQVRWPGRCQVLQKNPWVFLDGAINKTSAKLFMQNINSLSANKITAVLSIHTEKDLEGVCSVIAKLVDNIILTEVHTTGLLWNKNALLKIASKYFKNVVYISSVNEAFDFAKKKAKKDEGIILLGHQSFVGAALGYWDVDTSTLW